MIDAWLLSLLRKLKVTCSMRQQPLSRTAAPSVEVYSEKLLEGQSPFVATRYVVQPRDKGEETRSMRVVMANGLYETRRALTPLVKRMVGRACLLGDGLDVLTYDEPLVGRRAYGLDDRTARLNRVVEHMRDVDVEERPVHLAGHSLGNASSLIVGEPLARAGKIDGLLSIGGVGYTPRRREEVTTRTLVSLTAQELAAPANWQEGCEAWPVLGTLLGNGALHFAANYPAAVREAQTILTANLLPEGVALSHTLPEGAMAVWALTRDRFCPGGMMAENLQRATPAFRGAVELVDTTHAGPLLDPALTAPLYDQLMGLGHVAA